jgi:uncharacterized membrane protein
MYDIFALPNPQEQQTQSTEILTKINQKQMSKQLTPYFPLYPWLGAETFDCKRILINMQL